MIDLLECHKMFLAPHIKPGCTAADFTMGNGHDTLWLCRSVYGGEEAPGHVYAFDIQPSALVSTRARLCGEGCPENYTLINASHADAGEYIKEPINAGVFNLGWLPGGDKSVTTRRESTLPAIKTAIELLAPDGGLIIAVYPGHEEGRLEGEMISGYLSTLSRFKVCASVFRIVNSPTSPYFFIVEKK